MTGMIASFMSRMFAAPVATAEEMATKLMVPCCCCCKVRLVLDLQAEVAVLDGRTAELAQQSNALRARCKAFEDAHQQGE